MIDRPRYVPLDNRGSLTNALCIDTSVPMQSLLETAHLRVHAAKKLALALASAGSENSDGLEGGSTSAAGLAIGILTADASAVMDEMEMALIRQNKQEIKEGQAE